MSIIKIKNYEQKNYIEKKKPRRKKGNNFRISKEI